MEQCSALHPSPIQPGTAQDRPYSLMSGFRAFASSMSHHSSAKEAWGGGAGDGQQLGVERCIGLGGGDGLTAAFVVEVVASVHVARLRRLGGLTVAPDPAASQAAPWYAPT
jgi:hypothetical protein